MRHRAAHDGARLIGAGIVVCLRAAIGLLFLRAGFAKLRGGAGFADIVAGYRLVPSMFVGPVAFLITLAELTVAGLLFAGVALPAKAAGVVGGGLAALLLAGFAAAMAINLRRGRAILCGCGTDATLLTWSGCAATALLVLPACVASLAVAPIPLLLAAQATIAGGALLLLREAAGTLAAIPPRAPRPA